MRIIALHVCILCTEFKAYFAYTHIEQAPLNSERRPLPNVYTLDYVEQSLLLGSYATHQLVTRLPLEIFGYH